MARAQQEIDEFNAYAVYGLERAEELGHPIQFQEDRHEQVLPVAAAPNAQRPCFNQPCS